jgi:hypothetical protein
MLAGVAGLVYGVLWTRHLALMRGAEVVIVRPKLTA